MNKSKHIRTICILFSVIFIIVAISGCNDGTSESKKETSNTNEINVMTATYPLNLDPYTCTDSETMTIIKSLYEGLTKLDDDGNAVLNEATSITLSDDNMSATIKLKDNIKYADGKDITAQDYINSWEKAVSSSTNSPYSSMFDAILNGYEIRTGQQNADTLGAYATNEDTIIVNFSCPCYNFNDMLSFPVFYPIREDEQGKEISNSAYEIEKYDCNSVLTLKKNNNYYDKDNVKPDKINFILGKSEIDSPKTLNEENLQFTDVVGNNIDSIISQEEFLYVNTVSTTYLAFQTAKQPFDNNDIRQALSLSINRNEFEIKKDSVDVLIPSTALIPEEINDSETNKSFRDYKKQYYATDLSNKNIASQKLSINGYPNGKGFKTIDLLYDKTKNDREARLVQQMWYENLGVTAKLDGLDTKSYNDALQNGDYDVAIANIQAPYNDALPMLEQFVSDNNMNYTKYYSEEYNCKIAEAKSAETKEERYNLLHQCEDILMQDMPCAPLYYGSNFILKDKALNDVSMSKYSYYDFTKANFSN